MQLPIQDKIEALQNYDENLIDKEFLPFVKRINQLEFVITCQCCTGHMTSPDGNWGYISMFVNPKLVPFLNYEPNWLLKNRSKTWYDNTITPTLTPNGSLMLVFAWKAEFWPVPIIEITESLESIKEL